MSVEKASFSLLSASISTEDCLTQSLITLEEFNKKFGNLMDKINSKIESRMTKLNSIRERIKRAKETIQKANKSAKVVRICSPGYFPKTEKRGRNDLSLSPREASPLDLKYKLTDESSAAAQTRTVSASVASFDLLHQKSETPKFSDGIGGPPDDLRSTSNLLIYNTRINPYKHYQMTDPLNVVPKSSRPEKREQLPAQAPQTVTLGHQFDSLQRLNFDYNPILGNVPQIQVPDSLPELSGIVTDLTYSANERGIAPSIILTEITVDLPDLDSDPIPAPSPVIQPTPPIVSPVIQPTPPIVSPVSEPAPQTPSIPPPQPLPSTPQDSPPSMMKSLLDSIVKAGGTDQFKFKQKTETPKPVKPPKEDPEDVMSQLKKALRRRGESLKGCPVVEPPAKKDEPNPFIKSISQIIKTDYSGDEPEDNWSD